VSVLADGAKDPVDRRLGAYVAAFVGEARNDRCTIFALKLSV
jgi:hypothetical protein